ncbi:hypothetical protein [Actinoplanes sp. NBRC 103695]|uniref:hypothetical protein n=1 Tax=Actinoplanes sp. NBRC 103695 TaxID=3032202 RepID=UPI0024A46B7F|nr:hypothetical protein [Actinoplanes sp. NBRC 103695]GLY99815.1 hypothetical protein Acsp02_70680 [Actinoplanes sp. NBRC 103695]
MTDLAEQTPDAARRQLVDQLTTKGRLASPRIADAFLSVPREVFAPAGTSLQAAYADDVVVTKRDQHGEALSSISAPWLQAQMLAAADLQPGDRVLEVGSGVRHEVAHSKWRRQGGRLLMQSRS